MLKNKVPSCVFLVFTLASSLVTYAQTTLTGTTYNSAGRPIEGAMVEVNTNGKLPTGAFVLTNAQGIFKLTLPATPASDSLRLLARALGYAEQLVRLANRSQPVARRKQRGLIRRNYLK